VRSSPSSPLRRPARALILDFDGVIMDTESAVVAAWRDECADLGLPFDEAAFVATIGVPSLAPERVLARLGGRVGDPVDFAVRVRARLTVTSAALPVLPGVLDLLVEAERDGVAVAVASGARREWVTGHLNRAGLLRRLAVVVCRDDVAAGKPAPDLYLLALQRLGVAASSAVAVEDSATGVAAARAAGMRCVGVPGPVTRGHDLAAATLLLPTLAGVRLVDLLTAGWVPNTP
jgi:HAD superfamily hydrolase (TIGR01509 family)